MSFSRGSEIPTNLVYMHLIYRLDFFLRHYSKVPTFAEWLEYFSFPESFWFKL